ncbi:MAG: DNA cytosine methyltransferase [Gammaproteobacteria bacterium]
MPKGKDIGAVDFFCGAGGLTCGLLKARVKNAGISVVAGIDSDEKCRFPYEENNKGAKFIHKKIEDVRAGEVGKLVGGFKWKVFVGCAPCQPFSSYTLKARKSVKNTGNWNLIEYFMKNIKAVKPDVVSMENVPQLIKQEIFSRFVKKLEKAGYSPSYSVVNCARHGMPQSRRRLVLLASRHGEINFPAPSKKTKTLYNTIGKMPELENGKEDAGDSLHVCAKLGETNLKRILASSPGGTWEDWDEELLPECYKKASGQTYKNVYGRMSWNEPAPTITGQFYRYGTGRFGHPEQSRALSLREGALIQTFPKKYKFFPNREKFSRVSIGMQIGNAVPVKLGKLIGNTIIQHIQEISHG